MYDIAREQTPDEKLLMDLIDRSAGAGYNALGLYLEHRFAYPSAPWAAGPGCLTPKMAGRLSRVAAERGVRLIPFLNTLGHMEGFIRSEGGQWLAEAPGKGVLQMCPSRPECIEFVSNLVVDVLQSFKDEWVHLGGDETHQLGECPLCARRVEEVGKEGLYVNFFGALCRQVLDRGKRPCMWGDILAKYPGSLDLIPQETVIFDWNYKNAPGKTCEMFQQHGFEVVLSSAVRSYDSNWCFLDETCSLIDAHREEAERFGTVGTLVCAWEFFGFSQFASVLPLIMAAGRRVSSGEAWETALVAEGGEGYAHAAKILGSRIPRMSSFLAAGGWRPLRECMAIQSDPFSLWRAWREEACGRVGDAILEVLGEADEAAGLDSPLEFPLLFQFVCVEWVRLAERAAIRYAAGDAASAADILAEGMCQLMRLRPGLERFAEGGGSAVDPARLDASLKAIERACFCLRLTTGASGARPSFNTLTQVGYLPGDQAGWRTEGPAVGRTARG